MPVHKGSTKARVPSKLKLLRGTFNGSRSNPDEPETEAEIPTPPEYLTALQRSVWMDVSEVLQDYRVTSPIDAMAFETLVCTWADCRKLRQDIRDQAAAGDDSLTYESLGEGGAEMRRVKPEMQLLKEREASLRDWLGRFGLTPADRGRVSSKPDKRGWEPEDEFAQ
jgi:P27 family predicted phage terminase small subunit